MTKNKKKFRRVNCKYSLSILFLSKYEYHDKNYYQVKEKLSKWILSQ